MEIPLTSGMFLGRTEVKTYMRSHVTNDCGTRIYFQAPDNHIQEICFDGNSGEQYNNGHSFPTPLKGTALAFVYQPRSARDPGAKGVIIRGYYQHTDLRIMEIVW